MDVQLYDYKKYNSKPAIRIGNYYFQWEVNALGIDLHETNHLKNFIRKTIPELEQYMLFLQNEGKENDSDRKYPYNSKKQICIKEKYNKRISFLMFIDSQGSTLFYREECCEIDDNKSFELETGDGVHSENSSSNTSDRNDPTHGHDHGQKIEVEIKWFLGELLFDRKIQNQKK